MRNFLISVLLYCSITLDTHSNDLSNYSLYILDVEVIDSKTAKKPLLFSLSLVVAEESNPTFVMLNCEFIVAITHFFFN